MAAALVIACIALFIRLGFWQLQRAEEKRQLLQSREAQGQLAPLDQPPSEASVEAIRYRRISLFGRYDTARQVLLDNQVYNGRVGYQALTPLIPAGGGCAVLVNRGWLPAGANRATLPELAIGKTESRAEGIIDRFPAVGMKLKGAEALGSGNPLVLQLLDAARLSERFGYCVQPYQILLSPEAEEGYVREWRMSHVDPDKSLGYAVQWFAMAAALFLYAGWITWRRGAKNPHAD